MTQHAWATRHGCGQRESVHIAWGAAFPGVQGRGLFIGEIHSLLVNLKHRSRNKNFKCN